MTRRLPRKSGFTEAALAGIALLLPRVALAEGPLERARVAIEASRYDDARALLAEARRDGASSEVEVDEARVALLTGRYEDALRLARQAGKRPQLARRAAPIAAEALARVGKREEAIRELERLRSDDDAHRAHVALGELYVNAGRRDDAEEVLMKVIEAYNSDRIGPTDAEGLALAGRAAFLLRQPKDANDLYAKAEDARRERSAELLRWRAELFLDKYDPGHAGEVMRDALRKAPRDPRARVAMAHVKLDQTMDFAAAEAEVSAALEVDPRLAEAYFVRAGLALRTMDLDAADAAVKAGLAVDPTNLDLLSMAAATRFLADDPAGFEAHRARVLALNPKFARFFAIVAEFAEWEHRYDEIVRLMREAVVVDPDEAKAHAALGLNLIRAGDDEGGLAALRKAFARDDYNVRVYNTLNFYEKTVAKDYVTVDGARFRIRYHRDEKAVLERYLPKLLDRAWSSMVERYRFTPSQPIGIELYANPEHFSIRTSGLPAVGIQGVCFGKTLAALSPGAGSFNWGMIVWHELSHVFHIQKSKSHVPRWFTEGLAEYETILARPEWRREEERSLFLGLRDGKLPTVASFNRAFTHVESPLDVVMAYYAASQIQVFAGERFGFERFGRMLDGWAAGRRTDELVRDVYGIPAEEFDRRYREWQAPRLERYRRQFLPDTTEVSIEAARKALSEAPRDAARHVALARAFFAEGKPDEGAATLTLALQLDPKEPNALYLKLLRALADEQRDEAQRSVEALLAAGHDGYAVRMKAADVAELREDAVALRRELWLAHERDPSQAEPLQALHDLARKSGDEEGQLATLRMLAQLDQHDRRVWRRLLALLVKRGLWEEAVRVGEAAMYVDVMRPETHLDYALALARTGRQVSAIFELNSALKARPDRSLARRIYARLAAGYRKLGKPEYAARAEAYAAALPAGDPAEADAGREPD